MLAGKTREELERALVEPTLLVKRKRKVVKEIKDYLFNEYKIIDGNVQSWINNPKNELSKLDWRVLCLFAEQIYVKTKNRDIDPNNYYTSVEIKKAKQFTGKLIAKKDISLPLVFKETTRLGYAEFVTTIDVSMLAEMSSVLLNYNFDIQREARKIQRGGETIREATLVMENVLEIKNHLKEGTLKPTNIVINASVGTADDGDEITYNSDTRELIIHEGTILDIVDGYHRCRGSELAINEKPDIDFKFILTILNYTDDEAAKYQGQLAEATPISKPKKKQLSAKRHADAIVKELMIQSELKGRVAMAYVPSIRSGELVTYDVLSDIIDEQFDLNRMIEVHKVGNFLKMFFDILLGEYEDQFIENPAEWKKKSVMAENNMFIGYIVLARRMYENNIPAISVINILQEIDFSRDNPQWVEIGFLKENGKLNDTKISRQVIKDFFTNLKI